MGAPRNISNPNPSSDPQRVPQRRSETSAYLMDRGSSCAETVFGSNTIISVESLFDLNLLDDDDPFECLEDR